MKKHTLETIDSAVFGLAAIVVMYYMSKTGEVFRPLALFSIYATTNFYYEYKKKIKEQSK